IMQGDADEDNAVLLEMQKRLNDYVAAVEPVVAQIKSGGYDSATVANRMLGRAHDQYAALLVDMQKLQSIIMQEAASLQKEEAYISGQTTLWFGVALALAALVVVPSTLANMQSICQPLDQAQRVGTAIMQGDL